jgi:hypothetical protein
MNSKLLITLCVLLILFFNSCGSINYKIEQDKLYIDDESVCIITTLIANTYNLNLKSHKKEFHEYDTLNPERVYVKDLPHIWRSIGLYSDTINTSDSHEIEKAIKKADEEKSYLIIIYEKSSYFSQKRNIHADLITGFDRWDDGSYIIYKLNAVSNTEEKIDNNTILSLNYISIWALKPMK